MGKDMGNIDQCSSGSRDNIDYGFQKANCGITGCCVYLNITDHFTIRTWVNRSERLQGEPLA